jgi:hypothetical protein
MKNKHYYKDERHSLRSDVFLFSILFLCVSSPFLTVFGNFTGFDILILIISIWAFLDPRFRLPKTIVFVSLVLILTSISSMIYTAIFFEDQYDPLTNFAQVVFLASFCIVASVYITSVIRLKHFLDTVVIFFIGSVGVLWVSLFVELPIVKFDLVSRYLPIFSGFSALFIIANAYCLYKFSSRQISSLHLLIVLLISFLGIYVTQQRSLLAGLIFGLAVLSITEKRSILLVPLALSVVLYNYELIFSLVSDFRVVSTFLLDNGRVKLVEDFLTTITANPSVLLHGYGIEKWTGGADQEPHNVVLHMISDYGIFGAFTYITLVFGFGFNLFKSSSNLRLFTLFLVVCMLPNFMLHTYTLERGQLMLFMILSAYFFTSRFVMNAHVKSNYRNDVSRANC